ncbi:exported protein [Pandoraea sp. NE5]|uniref:O-antigen ligase family protein n=1 Tax=unclassified Pandoraea TaxID=2624094 RepID=UPI00034CB29E|nr:MULTISPECIES: O-antigen ligase family protein [unclassified Pandoraea]BDD92190.1 exported protein [Pandoraea sp. NE5]
MIYTLAVAGLVLAFPAFSLSARGGASTLLILATALSLISLSFKEGRRLLLASVGQLSRMEIVLCLSMAAPLLCALLIELIHGQVAWDTLDSPSRFVAAIPIFLALRSSQSDKLRWSDLSFALGGLAATLVTLPYASEWGTDRFGSYFLNPIHFGDIALIFGVMSLMSLHWHRRDSLAIVALKLLGTGAGLFASLLTGSRGGWIALPVMLLIVLGYRFKSAPLKWKVGAFVLLAAAATASYFTSSLVQERIVQAQFDIRNYEMGNRDTSIGIRLQLWETGLREFARKPWTGLGANGYKLAMPRLQAAGELSSRAAQAGEGEMHNQMIAYAVDYGVFGWVSLMLVYLGPIGLFHCAMRSASSVRRRAALLGLCFVVAFWIFGLTVETFNLKSTVSTYVVIVAILAAIVTAPDREKSQETTSG